MRVRGYTGGYYLDALAAIDIALWDIAGQIAGLPLCKLLGGQRLERIPAYVSACRNPRGRSARRSPLNGRKKGFDSFKFASPVADDGVVAEIATLREALGPKARISCDMHWAHKAGEARMMIRAMEAHGLWFAEAPVARGGYRGLAEVAQGVSCPVAAGEEWRTAHDAEARLSRRACAIIQPEMGHKGVTEFMRIATSRRCITPRSSRMRRSASGFSSRRACMPVPPPRM